MPVYTASKKFSWVLNIKQKIVFVFSVYCFHLFASEGRTITDVKAGI